MILSTEILCVKQTSSRVYYLIVVSRVIVSGVTWRCFWLDEGRAEDRESLYLLKWDGYEVP